MNSRGFSLTELITTMVIIGLMLAVVSLNFNQWMRKASIEAQVKEMHNDLSDIRLQAVQTKMRHEVVFQDPGRYVFNRYTTEGTTVATPVSTRILKYPIRYVTGGALQDFSGELLTINTRGYTFNLYTIVVGLLQDDASTDCLVVSTTRVNMGKYDAATQNCTFK